MSNTEVLNKTFHFILKRILIGEMGSNDKIGVFLKS
jgi:hypothetical protein